MRLNYFKNIVNLNILISLIIYFLETIVMLPLDVLCLFPDFFITKIKLNNMFLLMFGLIFITSSSIFVKSFNKSYDNLSNLNSVQENYPIFKLKEIEKTFRAIMKY